MKDLCKKITLFFTPRAWRFFPEVFDLAPDPVNFRLYLKNPMANTEQHKNLQALERGGRGRGGSEYGEAIYRVFKP